MSGPENRPNILYLHAHDAGRYVQPYGFPVETPNLMRFASEGILFRKAFAAAPTCGPSRCAMLTGQSPHRIGVYGLPGPSGWRIDDYNKHLVHRLNDLGYRTALAGCMHEVEKPAIELLGYQQILKRDLTQEDGEFYPDTITNVERFLAEEHQRPYFLSVGIDEPHRNNMLGREDLGIGAEGDRFSKTRYYDPDRLDWRYTAPPPFLPDLPEIRRDMRSYAEGVKIMDEYMGRVLNALEQYGLAESTLVIVTTDHGIEFPGSKKTLSDQGTGVMLMMRGPGGFSGGRIVESLVSHLDLYPTLLDLLGVPIADWLEGVSILPLIDGHATGIRDEVFFEQTYHSELEPLRAVRTERYKYVRRHFSDGPRHRFDGRLSNSVCEKIGWFDRSLGHEELFDLYLDPWETCNRIDDPALAEIRRQLSQRLDRWMEATDDPFPTAQFPPVPHPS